MLITKETIHHKVAGCKVLSIREVIALVFDDVVPTRSELSSLGHAMRGLGFKKWCTTIDGRKEKIYYQGDMVDCTSEINICVTQLRHNVA